MHETDMVLLPEGLKALKRVAKEVGLDLRGAYLNLDGGFDSTRNRKCIFNAGFPIVMAKFCTLGRAPLRCGSEVTPAERSLALLPVVWSPLSA